jgi:predicted MFS family arabinose efflux permease
MVLVLDQGQGWGWGSFRSILLYILSIGTLISFIIVEKKQKEPIVDLKFFKITTFSAAIVTSFITFMGMIGGIFLIPLFAQNYLGYSVTKAGLLFIPMAIGLMIAAQLGARLSARIQPRFLVAGGMFWAAVVFFSLSGIDIKWTAFDLSARLFLFAFGLGLGFAPLTQAATSTVPIHEIGVASSILALARNLSGAFGIAIFATILSNSTTSQLFAIQHHSVINSTNPLMIGQIYGLMATKANILAFSVVFKVSAMFMIMGAFSAFMVKESKRDFETKDHEAAPMEM